MFIEPNNMVALDTACLYSDSKDSIFKIGWQYVLPILCKKIGVNFESSHYDRIYKAVKNADEGHRLGSGHYIFDDVDVFTTSAVLVSLSLASKFLSVGGDIDELRKMGLNIWSQKEVGRRLDDWNKKIVKRSLAQIDIIEERVKVRDKKLNELRSFEKMSFEDKLNMTESKREDLFDIFDMPGTESSMTKILSPFQDKTAEFYKHEKSILVDSTFVKSATESSATEKKLRRIISRYHGRVEKGADFKTVRAIAINVLKEAPAKNRRKLDAFFTQKVASRRKWYMDAEIEIQKVIGDMYTSIYFRHKNFNSINLCFNYELIDMDFRKYENQVSKYKPKDIDFDVWVETLKNQSMSKMRENEEHNPFTKMGQALSA